MNAVTREITDALGSRHAFAAIRLREIVVAMLLLACVSSVTTTVPVSPVFVALGAVLAIRGDPPRSLNVRVALAAGNSAQHAHFWLPAQGRRTTVPPFRGVPGAVLVPPNAQATVVSVRPIGIVLLIVGLVGAIVSLVFWAPWRRPAAPGL